MRYRLKGSTVPLVSLSLITTNRSEAIDRMNELSNAAKYFLLDDPTASPELLNAHLKSIAESLLMDDARAYWSHDGSVDTLGDLTGHLRTLALGSLNVDQHKALLKALEVVSAANERVSTGNAKPLVDLIDSLGAPLGAPVSILNDSPEGQPTSFHAGAPSLASWETLVNDCIAEKQLTLREASIKDLTSSLRTVSKFLAESNDYMSRPVWLSVRDAMASDGLSPVTINKCLTKASMVISYALMNGQVTGRNPIERMKLKAPEGNRKPFSEAQLNTLGNALGDLKEPHRRSLVALGLLTGARIGELVQVTPSDVVTIDGQVFLDINDDGDKTLKNANSKRLVPLIDGLYGVSMGQLMEDVKHAEEAGQTLCKVTRDSASKWFNEVFVKATLADHEEGLVFHSLRHSMATQCKARGVSEVDAGSILGHKAQSITYGLYGKTQALGRLVDALKLLK